MALDPSNLLFRWLLPAVGGIGVGMLLISPSSEPSSDPTWQPAETKLPEEPAMIKLAALGGRTAETRMMIEGLLRSGARDEEIAPWLAPLLISDPGWLEKFIVTLPEARRIDLVRATLWEMGEISPDSVWDLIAVSPFAAEASRTTGTVKDHEGLEILNLCMGSPRAAEILFNPANGFPSDEVARFFRYGTRSVPNSRRILEEWISGRWEGDPPECVRTAWLSLRWEDEDALRELEKTVPVNLQEITGRFESLARLRTIDKTPTVDELAILGSDELADIAEYRAEAGVPLPLETLAQLPAEIRGQSLEHYFGHLYLFHTEMAREAVASLDNLGLTRQERQTLLEGAAYYEWSEQGDYRAALAIIERMPDREAGGPAKEQLLENLAVMDPEEALRFASTMPLGTLRTRIETLANGNLP